MDAVAEHSGCVQEDLSLTAPSNPNPNGVQEDLSLTLGNILEQEDVQFFQQGINFTSSCSKVAPAYSSTCPHCSRLVPAAHCCCLRSVHRQHKPKW